MQIAEFGQKHIFTTEGGIEVVVTELTKEFAKDNQVTVFNRWEVDKPKMEYPKVKNVRMINVPTLSNGKLNAQLYSMISSIQCLFDDYDVVHIHAEGPCVFIPLLKLAGKKVVVTIHGLDWQRAKWGKFASAYIKLGETMAGKFADRIIVLNDETSYYFRDVFGRHTTMIKNGVTVYPTTKSNLIAKYGLKTGNYILYLGRIVPEKRLDLLCEAYKQSKSKKKLVIAGEITDAVKEEPWYIEAKENKNIIFTGFARDDFKNQLLCNAQLFVLPSDIEGMSIALLEALGLGMRVLASDIKENKQLLKKYGNSFKAGDVNDLALKLKELSKLPFERSKAQYDWIKENYGWAQCAEKTKEVLEDTVLNGRK